MARFFLLQNKGKYFRVSTVIIFSAFLLIVGILLGYFLIENNLSTKQQIYNFENAELKKTTTNVGNALDEVATMCTCISTISFDKDFFFSADSDYANYLAMTNQIDSYLSMFNQINSISVYSSSGKTYHSQPSGNQDMDVTAAGKLVGKLHNTELYIIPDSDAYHTLYFNFSGEKVSHVNNKINISVNSIAFGKENLSFETQSKEYLLDKNGTVIASYDMSCIGRSLKEIYSLSNFLPSNGQQEKDIEKTTYIISVLPVEGTDLFTVRFTDKTFYSRYLNSNTGLNLILCVVILTVAIIVCMVLLQYFYRPIKNILKQIGQYQEISIEKNINEVDYIGQKFEQLYQSKLVLDKVAAKALNDLKTWNIAALQAQICPHFIYNTLDSINWLAFKYLDSDNEISVAAQDTAYIMRKSLDITRMFSDIEEEIDVTKKYLEIIDIRYEHRFKIAWQIDDSLLHCIIPRLCLQPMIENAVIHAFSGDSVDNDISIAIVQDGENIKISVTDNGIGISSENLLKIRHNISSDIISGESSIGLRNINQRCKIIFGNNYGITITSKQGAGSTFCLLIPKDEFNS